MVSRIIVITSGKGGTGKTTLTANLGVQLAKSGNMVLLVDLDIGLRNLDILCGMQDKQVYDIVDVTEGLCGIEDAIAPVDAVDGLFFLPAAQMRESTALSGQQLSALLALLRERFAFMLIDSPAGLGHGFRNAVTVADEAIIVTLPEEAALRDAGRARGIIEGIGLPPPAFVLNRYRPDLALAQKMLSATEIEEKLGLRMVGLIPESEIFAQCVLEKRFAVEAEDSAGQALRDMAERLLGADIPYPIYQKPGFWEDFRLFLRRRRGR